MRHIYALQALLSFSLCILESRGKVDWTATPFNPPAFPLAVRTPYLSTWLPQGDGQPLNGAWPAFWTGSIAGWAGFVKVDGQAYGVLGIPNIPASFTKAKQKSSTFTSTKSVFVMTAGPVDITLTFLSPVEASDLAKQSFPFSYLAISAESTDGNSHSVQTYSDISGEWVSSETTLPVTWSTSDDSDAAITHQMQLQNATQFSEANDRAHYGTAYYSASKTSGLTFQTGPDTVVRAEFVRNGKLTNTQDTSFRAIQDNWPVLAFAHDLGNVKDASSPVVVAVGHARDPVVQYIVDNGQLQERHAYFFSLFTSAKDAIESFVADFGGANERADIFDAQVNTDASTISEDYSGIVALSIRQAMATMEITLSKNSDGSFSNEDILIFMKEISSNGNMNTVDVIFPAWPLFLYVNPEIGKHLLEVLFRYQMSGQYPNKFAIHDIGAHYPRALGHNDGKDENMPVEESGNMIMMALSYAEKTGDNSQITKYANLLDQWAQFLITDSLIPAGQLSTDDFAGTLENQTNLAIKGIIGIRSMAEISKLLGDSTKSTNYTSIATDYVSQWQGLATAGNHLTLSYGDPSSWGLAYNLYMDKLLNLNLFPSSVYEMQTAWYKTVANSFGVPLDTRHTYTKSDWGIWTAAIMTDTSARDLFISSVKKYAAGGVNSQPFGDWYETVDGKSQGFKARPVVGGHLALLVLPSTTSTTTTTSQDNPQPSESGDPITSPSGAMAITSPPLLPVIVLLTVLSICLYY